MTKRLSTQSNTCVAQAKVAVEEAFTGEAEVERQQQSPTQLG